MNELSKNLVCVLVRGNLEFWLEADRATQLKQALNNNQRFIEINGSTISTFEIIGIFSPNVMEERTRRKNGQWQCGQGTWHEKGNVCECKPYKDTVTAHVEGVGEVTYKR